MVMDKQAIMSGSPTWVNMEILESLVEEGFDMEAIFERMRPLGWMK